MEERRRSMLGVGPGSASAPQYDDEISLVELWLVLVRHRALVLSITAIITALAVVFALIRSPKYEYTTTIQIGTRVQDNKTGPIEDPGTVLVKISDGYLPQVLHAYYHNNPSDHYQYKIKATIPKDSGLIVLRSKALESKGKTIVALENEVVAALEKDHEQITGVIRSGLVLQQQQAQHKLAQMVDQEALIRANIGRLKTSAALLRTQIKETTSLLASAQRNQEKAMNRPGDEARAMTMLMIENEIQQDRTRLANLQEQLTIKLAARRDSLNAQLAANARDQQAQQLVLKNIELRIKNLRETRAVVPPVRSLKPVGLTTIPLIVLGLIAGLILGVFGAFGREFLAQAQRVAGTKEEEFIPGQNRDRRRAA